MQISVVMCTRNRAEQLGRVLQSAAAMRVPEGLDWEFLLVDNGSTDATASVAESFSDRLPIRLVSEPVAGLSHARNRGVAEARGDYICWTDDDVEIDGEWLAAYAGAFERHPDGAFFGGRVIPVLEGQTPVWFTENRAMLTGLLADRDLGEMPIALSAAENTLPYGANYAVRAVDQRRHRYDADLGVGPGHKRLGEETQVLLAIIADGGKGYWVPGSRVEHLIPPARQTIDYVKVYNMSAGQTWAYLDHLGPDNFLGPSPPPGGRRWRGTPLYIWRKALTHWLHYLRSRNRAPTSRWLHHWIQYSYYRGAIDFWAQRRHGQR